MAEQRMARKDAQQAKTASAASTQPEKVVGRDSPAESHRGIKAVKRSYPALKPTTVFVRKDTQLKATRLLEDQETGKDFSDLIEELVSVWISKHPHA